MPESRSPAPLHVPGEIVPSLLATRDLSELKVLLAVAHLSHGGTRAVAGDELHTPELVRAVAGPNTPESGDVRVARALSRAVVNGSLLRVTVSGGETPRHKYVLPTRRGVELVDALRRDDGTAASELQLDGDEPVAVYRPNVFAFYEHHLGALTPLIAEQLRDAERSYPRAWVEDAILAAAEANTTNWRYIETVLSRWEHDGTSGSEAPQRTHGT